MMPELRQDLITGRWVIISTERSKRESDWKESTLESRSEKFCPFCEGNESRTPPEIFAIRNQGTGNNLPGWSIRVVPNKYPALYIEGNSERKSDGLYHFMDGVGAHEVIIETPYHNVQLADMETSHIRNLLWVFQQRILDLQQDLRFKYILIFKNFGYAAGASLEHSHSQLIATPIIPKRVSEEIDGFISYFEKNQRCVLCDILQHEMEVGKRIVFNKHDFIGLAPFASRFPYELVVLPREHFARFEYLDENRIMNLAEILKMTFLRLKTKLNNPPYNFILHTSPHTSDNNLKYHWHMEIIPKLTKVAGFEWGTGFYINPVPPEEAAEWLR